MTEDKKTKKKDEMTGEKTFYLMPNHTFFGLFDVAGKEGGKFYLTTKEPKSTLDLDLLSPSNRQAIDVGLAAKKISLSPPPSTKKLNEDLVKNVTSLGLPELRTNISRLMLDNDYELLKKLFEKEAEREPVHTRRLDVIIGGLRSILRTMPAGLKRKDASKILADLRDIRFPPDRPGRTGLNDQKSRL